MAACCPTMEEFRNPDGHCIPRLSDEGFIVGCDDSFRRLPDDPESDDYPDDDPAKVVKFCPWCGTRLVTEVA